MLTTWICKQNTWWEGGIRVPAMVYSPLFDSGITGQSNDCLFHITDWFNTILGFAGNTEDLGVDGVDQWEAISSMGASCPRKHTIHVLNINNFFTLFTCGEAI